MIPYDKLIYGFLGERVCTRGYVDLHTIFREGNQTKTIPVCFLVIEEHIYYNVLLGRSFINTLGVMISTLHLAMKFPSASGEIITIHEDQKLTKKCYFASLRRQELTLATINVERAPNTRAFLIGEGLNPQIGTHSRIDLWGETKTCLDL